MATLSSPCCPSCEPVTALGENALGNGLSEERRRTPGIDLSGLDYISSAGLRVLLVLAKKLKTAGGRLALYEAKKPVQEVFDVAEATPACSTCCRTTTPQPRICRCGDTRKGMGVTHPSSWPLPASTSVVKRAMSWAAARTPAVGSRPIWARTAAFQGRRWNHPAT
jgi:hypothetical protein